MDVQYHLIRDANSPGTAFSWSHPGAQFNIADEGDWWVLPVLMMVLMLVPALLLNVQRRKRALLRMLLSRPLQGPVPTLHACSAAAWLFLTWHRLWIRHSCSHSPASQSWHAEAHCYPHVILCDPLIIAGLAWPLPFSYIMALTPAPVSYFAPAKSLQSCNHHAGGQLCQTRTGLRMPISAA